MILAAALLTVMDLRIVAPSLVMRSEPDVEVTYTSH